MQQFLAFVAAHWVISETALGVFLVAFISCMPKNPPASFAEYWAWMRSALQTAIPAARPHEPASPLDSPLPLSTPADPAQPKQ